MRLPASVKIMFTLTESAYSNVDISQTNRRKALKFELMGQNSTLFHMIQERVSSGVVKDAKIGHIKGGTRGGHPRWGCEHNFDA